MSKYDRNLRVEGLPLQLDKGLVVGPTILDMMVRTVYLVEDMPEKLRKVVPEGVKGAAIWTIRDTDTLWRKPGEGRKRPAKEIEDLASERTVDHPFKTALASGGLALEDQGEFLLVKKATTVSISEVVFKLAVGMSSRVDRAYSEIGGVASKLWDEDLDRARKLWTKLAEAGYVLYESPEIAELRPLSSVSQEVERLILLKACGWMGVNPDIDYSRRVGRPEAGSEGEIVFITFNAKNEVSGTIKRQYSGVASGTNLADLGLRKLVELLGSLRSDKYDVDFDLLEAFLDVSVPDWRDQAAAFANEDQGGGGGTSDPYEVLGVSRNASIEDIKLEYRRIMQRVHPDISRVSGWFARMAADAYRKIREERGEDVE